MASPTRRATSPVRIGRTSPLLSPSGEGSESGDAAVPAERLRSLMLSPRRERERDPAQRERERAREAVQWLGPVQPPMAPDSREARSLRLLLQRIFPAVTVDSDGTQELGLATLFQGIGQRLNAIKSTEAAAAPNPGRLGGHHVNMFVVDSTWQQSARLDGFGGVEASSSFPSLMGDVSVCSGKWMYEVTLLSCGIQQLGWCTLECNFTNENGVGDSVDSYAYDGQRGKVWNQGSKAYGDTWAVGDVIGCCIDLDAGTLTYYRNGKCLGLAFNNLRRGYSYGYFPAASLAQRERARFNLGAMPFAYPVAGYEPLEDPPVLALKQSSYLLGALCRVVSLLDRQPGSPQLSVANDASCVLAASYAFAYLKPLLKSRYVVRARLLPLMHTLRVAGDQRLHMFLNLAHAVNPKDAWTRFVIISMQLLSEQAHRLYDWEEALHSCLELVAAMLSNAEVRRTCLAEHENLALINLFTVKRATESDIKRFLPTIWTPFDDASTRSAFEARFQTLERAVAKSHRLRTLIIQIMLLEVPPTIMPSTMNGPVPTWLNKQMQYAVAHCKGINALGQSHQTAFEGLSFALLEALVRNGDELPYEAETSPTAAGGSNLGSALFAEYDDENMWTADRAAVQPSKSQLELVTVVSPRTSARLVPASPRASAPEALAHGQPSNSTSNPERGSRHSLLKGVDVDEPASSVSRHASAASITTTNIRPRRLTSFPSPTRINVQPLYVRTDSSATINLGEGDKAQRDRASSATSQDLAASDDTSLRSPLPIHSLGALRLHEYGSDRLFIQDRLGLNDINCLGGLLSSVRREAMLDPQSNSAVLFGKSSLITVPRRLWLLHFCMGFCAASQPSVFKIFRSENIGLTTTMDAAVDNQRDLQAAEADMQARFQRGLISEAELERGRQLLRTSQANSLQQVADAERKALLMTLQHFGRHRRRVTILALYELCELLEMHREWPNVVPTIYLDNFLEMATALHSEPVLLLDSDAHVPFYIAQQQQELLRRVIAVMCMLLRSPKVVVPDVQGNLLTHLRHFMAQPAYVRVVEENEALSREVLLTYMEAYDGKLWVAATDAFLSLGLDRGFAYKACERIKANAPHYSPFDSSSAVLVQRLQQLCLEQTALAYKFINHLLNQANWTVAELSQVIGELQDPASSAASMRDADTRYRRGVLLHELGVSLARLIEALVRDLPELFLGSSAEARTSLVRLLELALHLLDRSAPGGFFASVLENDVVTASSNSWLMQCPALGILMNLVAADGGFAVAADLQSSKLLGMIATSPQLKRPYLEYLNSPQLEQTRVMQLAQPDERSRLRAFAQALLAVADKHATQAKSLRRGSARYLGSMEEDEDDLCAICYAAPNTARLMPCQHKCCDLCITRHLMNSDRCFFCNAHVDSVDHGEVSVTPAAVAVDSSSVSLAGSNSVGAGGGAVTQNATGLAANVEMAAASGGRRSPLTRQDSRPPQGGSTSRRPRSISPRASQRSPSPRHRAPSPLRTAWSPHSPGADSAPPSPTALVRSPSPQPVVLEFPRSASASPQPATPNPPIVVTPSGGRTSPARSGRRESEL